MEVVFIKVLVTGGTGFIGKILIGKLLSIGHEVVVLTRNKEKALKLLGNKVSAVEWDHSLLIVPTEELENTDAVINLAGESIAGGRWTDKRKEQIISSRTKTTKSLVEAISDNVIKPKVLINASAIGYYGFHSDDKKIDEKGPAGEDFLAEVTARWEEEADKAETFDVRVAKLRIGLVLGKEGALKQMLTPFKMFIGGPMGSGEQWYSWIHVDDLVEIILYTLNNEEVSGSINCTAPQAVKMKDFSKVLGEVMKRPSWLKIPGSVLKIALGEMSDLLLKGQRVYPKRLMDTGYKFKYKELDKALANILK